MNVNLYVIEDYRKNDDFAVRKNKPNSNPILSTVGGFRKAKMNNKNLKNLPSLTFTGTPDPSVFPHNGHLFDQAKRIPLFLGGFCV